MPGNGGEDIKFVDGYVFFCGSYNDSLNGESGCIGYLGLSDLTSSLVTSVNITYRLIPQSKILTKLVAYRDESGRLSAVAIGTSHSSLNPHMIVHFPEIQTNYFYNIVEMGVDAATGEMDFLFEVLEIGDNIVFTGKDFLLLDNPMYIRVTDKNDVFYNPSFDTIHIYQSDPFEVNARIYSTDIDGRFIAMAYVKNAPLYTFPYSTMLRTIDVNTKMMIASQAIPSGDKFEPEDITYLPLTQKVALLQYQANIGLGYDYRIALLNPWALSSYNINRLFFANEELSSISNFLGKYYIARGPDRWYLQDSGNLSYAGGGCPLKDQFPVDVPVNLVHDCVVDVRTVNVFLSPFYYFTSIKSSIPIPTECSLTN